MRRYPPVIQFGDFEREDQDALESKSGSVKVLYHSLHLAMGPWVGSDATPAKNSDPWRAMRLNELGYFAGPCELVDADTFVKAKKRYNATRVDGSESNMDAALGRGDNAIPFLKKVTDDTEADVAPGDDLAGLDLKVFYEAIGFPADYLDSDDIPLRDQNKQGREHLNKHIVERQVLNRATIPLEVSVHLKDSASSEAGVFVPEAVGPVRVDWIIEDTREDFNRLYADDTQRNGFSSKFVRKVFTDIGVENCPKECGGIAEQGTGSALSAAWVGPHYPPYTAKVDYDNGVLYSRAHADTDKAARALGKTGLLFRSSIIAGDSYKITAALRFTGVYADALAAANGEIRVVTGTVQNWRQTTVATYLPWPARTSNLIDAAVWRRVKEEYGKAYLHLDINPAAIPTDNPGTILDAKAYKEWILGALEYAWEKGKAQRKADDLGIGTNLSNNAPVLLTHGNQDASMIKDVFANVLFGGKSRSSFGDASREELYAGKKQFADMIISGVRARKRRGFIVGDIDGWAQAVDHYDDLQKTNMFCVGMRDLLAYIDQNAPYVKNFMLAHEMGHCLWLVHYEDAGGRDPKDHDQSDHCCMMSYPNDSSSAPEYKHTANYDPHFCGKCNLKIRGWNVRAACIPERSGG